MCDSNPLLNCEGFVTFVYGEDWAWAEQANKLAKSSYHIENIMMTYVYNETVSRANP